MAKMIPTDPLPNKHAAASMLFGILKRLPDEFRVVQLFGSDAKPDYLVMEIEKKRALLLAASGLTVRDVRQIRPNLLQQEHHNRREEAITTAHNKSPARDIPLVIAYPYLPPKEVGKLSLQYCLSKRDLKPSRLAASLDKMLSSRLNDDRITQLRKAFTPEVIVPQQFTTRPKITRNTSATITPHLLDYNQEAALKADLQLPEHSAQLVRDFRLRLINGVAGSGKSLIVIYRASLLRQFFPHKRILCLTHNRALNNDLRRRYRLLSNHDTGVSWLTFMQWCRKCWPDNKMAFPKTIGRRQRNQLIQQIQHQHLGKTSISAEMLLEEIDWYKDNLLFSLDDYLAVSRSGRGFPLNQSMRKRVFAAMQVYHKLVRQRKLVDWGDIPRQMYRFIRDDQLSLPKYDFILIDEAQFFAPIWFEIVKALLTPKTGYLFLVADPSQGFLKRRQSWLASGLEVRGRTHRLAKSYRTTREILDFASLLYRTQLPNDEEDRVTPDFSDMPTGPLPMLLHLTSRQDEASRVVAEVQSLLDAGVLRQHILIIHAISHQTQGLIERFCDVFGQNSTVDPRHADSTNTIRICPLNAATGIESPIVFLLGVYDLYEREQSVRLAESERIELIRENTRKLYMAVTRAGQRVIVTYVGDVPPVFQSLIR